MLPPARLPTQRASLSQAGSQEKAPKLQWREDVEGLSLLSNNTIGITGEFAGRHVQSGRAAKHSKMLAEARALPVLHSIEKRQNCAWWKDKVMCPSLNTGCCWATHTVCSKSIITHVRL